MFYQTQHFGLSEYFHKERGKNFSFPTHVHHSFEFITIIKGRMTVCVGKDKYELKKGEGVLVFPEQLHSLESIDSEHALFIFSADVVSAFYSKHEKERPKCAKLITPPRLISEMLKSDENCSIIKLKGMLYSLCAMLDENTEYVKKNTLENGLLLSIFNFVENNYDKKCTLDTLGKAVGYNSSYLSRYFSNATGVSFVTYLNQYRISRACHVLKNTNKTVLECALDCGYTSLRNFNRNFKTHIGVSPKSYKNGK